MSYIVILMSFTAIFPWLWAGESNIGVPPKLLHPAKFGV
jgi:hypothetical protein